MPSCIAKDLSLHKPSSERVAATLAAVTFNGLEGSNPLVRTKNNRNSRGLLVT